LGCAAGLVVTFIAPPALALLGTGAARLLGLAAWTGMALAFQPTLARYRASPVWGIALPCVAAVYLILTLDSALQYARGVGGMWKGRAQAMRGELDDTHTA